MTHSMIRWGSGLASLILVAALAIAAPAHAQTDDVGLGLKGIGVRLGLTDPEGASSALMYGVHVDAGTFVRNVHIVPSLEYWNVGVADTDHSDLAVKVDVNLDFPLQDQRLVPYLGGGIGFHRLETSGSDERDNSKTKLGLSLQGGMRNEFTPNLALFGELGYAFVENANQLRILGGLTYKFIY